MREKGLLVAFFVLLSGAGQTEEMEPNGEYIYRLHGERLFQPDPQEPCPKPLYPFCILLLDGLDQRSVF